MKSLSEHPGEVQLFHREAGRVGVAARDQRSASTDDIPKAVDLDDGSGDIELPTRVNVQL